MRQRRHVLLRRQHSVRESLQRHSAALRWRLLRARGRRLRRRKVPQAVMLKG